MEVVEVRKALNSILKHLDVPYLRNFGGSRKGVMFCTSTSKSQAIQTIPNMRRMMP